MEWTIQDLGSLGEFVGSIGVVVTLFYLSAQIRSQNKESHANALNALTQQWADVTLMFCDADLNLVWQRGLLDFHGLDDNERGRFSSVIQNLTQTFEGLFLQHGLRSVGCYRAANPNVVFGTGYTTVVADQRVLVHRLVSSVHQSIG